ncbi:MAG: DNA-binding protein [Sulfuricurvum sp.]|nr:DNA-binding protein [Sulfuricurvum sp.]MDD5386865.1 DNA-binding protein [Sulfuricurvum sp.]
MKKMTIGDAAEHFGVSKEAIHNRIRRGSLNCIVENGVKYVAIESVKNNTSTNSVSDNRYTLYIESENERLREKVDGLEKETIRLRDQRELMLINERINVEQIYKERDAQLRNILNVVATKFLSHVSEDLVMQEAMGEEAEQADAINADIIPDIEIGEDWITLKAFLKLKHYPNSIKKNIKRRFKAAALEGDERFIENNEKIYLNPSLYEYSDLLAGR